jgi:hypothetical protein
MKPESATRGRDLSDHDLSDRELQDQIINYLADARLRAHPPASLPLSGAEAQKASKFARFLARRYYRDRLGRSFRYSRLLEPRIARRAEEIIEGAQFDEFLDACILGSLESARKVGEMTRVHLGAATAPGPWWRDLLQYEYAYFLQTATTEHAPPLVVPRRGVSALSDEFHWNLPEILKRLRAGQEIGTDLQDKDLRGTDLRGEDLREKDLGGAALREKDLRADVTLLFSLTPHGRVYVVEIDHNVSAVFRAANGMRATEQIAAAAGLPVDYTRQTLHALVELGAIVPPAYGREM